ncbi:MAG: CBS domain-containing protein [Thermoleophilaceae bacterium]|nr:CBS domain-containing protein [Thermoleophilaceae bacterium]
MSPKTLSDDTIRRVPLLRADQPLGAAVAEIVAAELPALPVVDAGDALVGIFGEREFIAAIFPGYIGELRYAGFVRKSVDEVLEQRSECAAEPVAKHMNTEHIDVGPDHSDAQLAEIFLHHRVLIIPVVEGGEVSGVVTRADFFTALAARLPT